MVLQLEPLRRGDAVRYDALGHIWVMTLFGPPQKADMLLASRSLQMMARRQPSGFPTLTWILPEAGLTMPTDAREAAASVTRQFDELILSQVTLIEGSGFRPAVVRSILVGLDLLTRAKSSKKTFGDMASAIRWCASIGGDSEPIRVADAIELLEPLRAQAGGP